MINFNPEITINELAQKLREQHTTQFYDHTMIEIATTVINEMVSVCLGCPTKCILDWNGTS